MQTVPFVMSAIRSGMRKHRGKELTIGEFRALIFMDRHAGCTISDVAERIGLSCRQRRNSSTDGQERTRDTKDRHAGPKERYAHCDKSWKSIFGARAKGAMAEISKNFDTMSGGEQLLIVNAMKILRKAFTPSSDAGVARKGAKPCR